MMTSMKSLPRTTREDVVPKKKRHAVEIRSMCMYMWRCAYVRASEREIFIGRGRYRAGGRDIDRGDN